MRNMVMNYQNEDFKELIKSRVLVDFYAEWCGPCKMLSPIVDNISKSIKVIKVNIDNYPALAREYGVMSIPCLILFNDGKEIKRNIGFVPEEVLKKFIQE